MKKQMSFMMNKMLLLRSLLTVFCVAAVLWGVSFVSHADEKGTITGSNVNLRAEASTTSTAIEVLSANALVDVLAETTGTDGNKWYKITTAAGNTGYVRADFVKKAVITVPVTEVEDKTAYIAGANANIRQDASTSSGRVANALGGSKVTIIGEATGADGYKWYQIEFTGNGATMTGFIRSDLVTFEAPTQDPEVTVIEGGTSEGSEPEEPSEEPSEPSEEPSEAPTEEPEPDIPVTSSVADLTIMEPVSAVEILPQGFEQTELKLGENVYTVWGKDDFYIMYASVNGGTPQYYLYDAANESYVSYTGLLTEADMNVQPEEEGLNFKLIAIICIGIIVVLALVIGILGFKLANAGYRDDDDDDDDDYYDDDDDDDEEEYVNLSDDDNEEEEDDEDDDDIFDFSDDDEEDDIMNIIPITEQMPVHEITENAVEADETYEEPVYETPVEEAVLEVPVEEAVYEEPVYEAPAEETVYEEPVYEAPVEEAVYEEPVYEAPAEEAAYEEPRYEETIEYSDEEEDMFDEESLEEETFEEEEEYVPSKKTKKDKKEKKKFGKRFLDFFTVEVEEDDEEEKEEEYDNDDDDDSEEHSSFTRFDDDDDDLNFIDI